MARTVARVALTFLPVLLIKNKGALWLIKQGDKAPCPLSEERRAELARKIRRRTWLLRFTLALPVLLFWATVLASLERTPLTGRWRLIALSPEEEEEIAAELAGKGWYDAVGRILSEDGSRPQLIPPSDWRYKWVKDTLTRLESSIPILVQESKDDIDWLDNSLHSLPPPSDFPLRPRPRATEYLRHMCERMVERATTPAPHSIPGPPYSLLVVENPNSSNAFSYGFGPDGGGGIVVYSGFLEDILRRSEVVGSSSWTSSLFGVFSSPVAYTPSHQETTDLAVLLSHELSHLILSHHLETLSSATVLLPGTMSILSDLLRVLIFPITALFGPFVNDAVAQLGKVGSGELAKMGQYCTSVKQEIEADVVSVRLLAHAGFDARDAVSFWEKRSASQAECALVDSSVKPMVGATHPLNQDRVQVLKNELVRWETERRARLVQLWNPPQRSSILLAAA